MVYQKFDTCTILLWSNDKTNEDDHDPPNLTDHVPKLPPVMASRLTPFWSILHHKG